MRRPTWLWRRTVVTATSARAALSTVIRIARSETTNPKPKCPSMTVVVALSPRTSNGAPGTMCPFPIRSM